MDPVPILFDQREWGDKGAAGFPGMPYIIDKIGVICDGSNIRLQRKLDEFLDDFVGELDGIRLVTFHMVAHAIDMPRILGWNLNVSV